MRRPVVCMCLTLAVAIGSPVALAQIPAAARQQSLDNTLQGDAKEAYGTAKILFNNGDFAGALAKYEQAYTLSKDPRLLFNMAVCARGIRAYAKMQALLVRYQRESGPAVSADEKAEVAGALAVIRNLVGSVKLTVSETGATVAVDGEFVGRTPLADPLVLDLGAHAISVDKPGFDPVQRQIQIAGGNDVSLSIGLVARSHVAQLVVPADDNATVIIDDNIAGKGRFDGQLPSGTHDLQVTEPGRVPFKTQVELRDGETRMVQVTLESEKAWGPIWPWLVGGALVAAGAAVGGYFLLKPQEAQGPAAPTGVLGSVRLVAWRP